MDIFIRFLKWVIILVFSCVYFSKLDYDDDDDHDDDVLGIELTTSYLSGRHCAIKLYFQLRLLFLSYSSFALILNCYSYYSITLIQKQL